jgi:two-component system response regulator HydG
MCAREQSAKEKMSILAVEDEQSIRDLYTTVLCEEGYNVVTSSTGADAIEKIMEGTFDLIILDLKLPDMHGTEVLKKTKDKIDGATLIIVTAYPSLESSMEAIKAGVYDYIVKPFSPEDLRMVIQRATEKVRLARENRRLVKELEKTNRELKERIGQLEKFTRIATGREEKMAELKERIKELENKLKILS